MAMRFKRITAAFDDMARARLCQSSGSEHSAADNSVTNLSDLVDSFLETVDEEGGEILYEENSKKNGEEERKCSETESYCSTVSETKELLINLIGCDSEVEEEEDSSVKRTIRAEIEMACRSLGNCLSEGFKRRVMTWLRQRGYDAGLCKSRWEKTARHPAGEYEYIDILISKTRYIVEVSLTTEFTIARPTKTYTSVLEVFPQVVVCKEGELKQVVRLMCAAMRVSLKKRDMHVPPWRRNGYVQAKWFGCYKRSTNATSSSSKVAYRVGDLAGKSLVGFESSPQVDSHCRGEVVRKGGLHGGNLKDVFNGMA